MSKVVLITGTSTGLGLSLAIKMAELGYCVYATMRDLAKATPLQEAAERGARLKVLPLDVQNMDSIQRCVDTIIREQGHIDILINNAGAGFVKSTEMASEAEIHWVMDVNYLGVVRCTKAVLPYMRKARSGRVVNISSVGGLVGQPFNELYCAAKFAVEGYTEAMASYIQPSFNILFTAVEPGGIYSEFANSILSQLQAEGGVPEGDYRDVFEQYLQSIQGRTAEQTARLYQSTEQVAQVVLQVIESDQPPVRVRTSTWANEFCVYKTEADPSGKAQQKMVIDTMLRRNP
ncbi:SDR family oxidoreductase [uncultured Microbulbifer sp.]|uniref:SDR family oxidoreductase n=1 Tax=uncultured Microbulbifer sp. TaxID=348147 RepID=UPI002620A859|nr:SDR family oxidoreductase [uncultured Microbulbifer sp.]